METETPTRMRVTIEGTGTATLEGAAIRLRTDEGSVVVLPAHDAGVELERLAPCRTWTDGDVVQHPTEGWTLTREHSGRWASSRNPRAVWDDERVTDHTDGERGNAEGWFGPLRVLRYQHDECDDGQHWLDAYGDRVHNHGTEDGPGLACPERDVPGRVKPVGACLDRDPAVSTWAEAMRAHPAVGQVTAL